VARLKKTIARRLRRFRAAAQAVAASPRRLDPAFDAPASQLLVGPPDFAPTTRLAAETGRTGHDGMAVDGPVPLEQVLARRADALTAGSRPTPLADEEVVVGLDSLAAGAMSADSAVLGLLGLSRARVIVLSAEGGDAAAALDTLAAALIARDSGQVAAVRPLRRGWPGAPAGLVVTRRRIGHLLLVAGPSASGKSSLMAPLTRDARPGDAAGSGARAANEAAAQAVAGYLGIARGAHWGRPAYAKRLSALGDPVREHLVLQYDFSRPLRQYWPLGQPDPVLDVLDCAQRVSAVTLWTPPPRLVRQAVQRARGRLPASARGEPVGKTRLYADPDQVLSMYQCYFDAVDGRVDGHCVVEAGADLAVYTPDAWRELVGAPACRIETGSTGADVATAS